MRAGGGRGVQPMDAERMHVSWAGSCVRLSCYSDAPVTTPSRLVSQAAAQEPTRNDSPRSASLISLALPLPFFLSRSTPLHLSSHITIHVGTPFKSFLNAIVYIYLPQLTLMVHMDVYFPRHLLHHPVCTLCHLLRMNVGMHKHCNNLILGL